MGRSWPLLPARLIMGLSAWVAAIAQLFNASIVPNKRLRPVNPLTPGFEIPPRISRDNWLLGALVRMKIVSAHSHVRATSLDGGVSSDIYRVELPSGVTVCVKR